MFVFFACILFPLAAEEIDTNITNDTETTDEQVGPSEMTEAPAPPFFIGWSPTLRLFGANIDLSIHLPVLAPQQYIHVRAGGAWETSQYHRNPDGSLFSSENENDVALANYPQIDTIFRLGFVQGLHWNDEFEKADLDCFALLSSKLILRYPDNDSLIVQSGYSDIDEVVLNSFMAGIRHDTVHPYRGGTEGDYAEFSVEYGPSWLANTFMGHGDFLRIHARMINHRALPYEKLFWVNGLYADQLFGGWSADTRIPLHQRGFIGGWDPRDGLGGAVRGFRDNRFDANTKLVNAMDLRLLLPDIGDLPIQSWIILYWDTGYYRDLEDAPVDSNTTGWISSNGIGIALSLLDLATVCAYTDFAWYGSTAHENDRVTLLRLAFSFHQ